MGAFYALAQLDYDLLADVVDWPTALHAVAGRAGRPLRLLDVACGSGRFPSTLLARGGLPEVDYDLLDPSPFSLTEAAGKLRAPLHARRRCETVLEDLDPAAGPWDVVWATHALYALEPAHLEAAAERFADALGEAGVGFVAQGASAGHYLAIDAAYRAGPLGAGRTPYLPGEKVAGAIRAAAEARGLRASERRLRYEHVVADGERDLLEGYLRRCLFDDRPSLDELLAAPVLGDYLAGCHDERDGVFRFPHEVVCLGLAPDGEDLPWTAAS